jgi:hypothetical protein
MLVAGQPNPIVGRLASKTPVVCQHLNSLAMDFCTTDT